MWRKNFLWKAVLQDEFKTSFLQWGVISWLYRGLIHCVECVRTGENVQECFDFLPTIQRDDGPSKRTILRWYKVFEDGKNPTRTQGKTRKKTHSRHRHKYCRSLSDNGRKSGSDISVDIVLIGYWIVSCESHFEGQTGLEEAVRPMGCTWPDSRPKNGSSGIRLGNAGQIYQQCQAMSHENRYWWWNSDLLLRSAYEVAIDGKDPSKSNSTRKNCRSHMVKKHLLILFSTAPASCLNWNMCNCEKNRLSLCISRKQCFKPLLLALREKYLKIVHRMIFLQHDYAPSYTAAFTISFLREKIFKLLHHPLYAPDWILCDFFLFWKLKVLLLELYVLNAHSTTIIRSALRIIALILVCRQKRLYSGVEENQRKRQSATKCSAIRFQIRRVWNTSDLVSTIRLILSKVI